MVTTCLYESGLNKNDIFNARNQSCLVTQICIGKILTEIAVLEIENYSFMILKHIILHGSSLTEMLYVLSTDFAKEL